MNAVVKYVVGRTYKPLLEKYLSSTRIYKYQGLRLQIPPEVFHPRFFFSTQFLLEYVGHFELKGKSVLELGAGSGLIAMHTAKRGATVTASDINRTAIEYLHLNARENAVDINIVESDLFLNIRSQQFDFLLINPPYFKKDPQSEKEFAWYCGRKGEYFDRLFHGLKNYIHEPSKVLMVLCDDCDLQMIERMAHQNGFAWDCVEQKRSLAGWHYIYSLRQANFKRDPFVDFYMELREKENRVYSDEEVRHLPEIRASHPNASEWVVRERSMIELLVFLRLLRKPFDILEIGCGNGWLSRQLANIPRCRVTGIDVNQVELTQAKRVFKNIPNLNFLYGDLRKDILKDELFDVIVFAASIQYFEDLEEILLAASKHLRAGGAIHIIDTCFYKENELKGARNRSREYFKKIGFPEMAAYYFHHSFNTLKKFHYRVFFDPKQSIGQTEKRDRMFPWICIQSYS
jgi:release factor glutamine methyltransferase